MMRQPLKPSGVISRRAILMKEKLMPHVTTAASMRTSLRPKRGPWVLVMAGTGGPGENDYSCPQPSSRLRGKRASTTDIMPPRGLNSPTTSA